jgi:hypothetical protein
MFEAVRVRARAELLEVPLHLPPPHTHTHAPTHPSHAHAASLRPPPNRPMHRMFKREYSALKPFVIISLSYLLFTTTDGAVRCARVCGAWWYVLGVQAAQAGWSGWLLALNPPPAADVWRHVDTQPPASLERWCCPCRRSLTHSQRSLARAPLVAATPACLTPAKG